MKNLLQQYRPFLLFLGKFLLTYVLITVLYQSYLNRFDSASNQVDSFTQMVASQTQTLLTLFDNDAQIESHPTEPSVKSFITENMFLASLKVAMPLVS